MGRAHRTTDHAGRARRRNGHATPERKVKWRYVVALVACVGAIVWMITSLSANIDYLETVSQAVRDRPSQENRELRIGGVVVLHT